MSTEYLGGHSLAVVVPMLLDAANAISGAAYLTLPELQARLDSLAKVAASVSISPPSLTVLADIVAKLQQMTISASVDFELMAKIQVQLVGLYAFIALQVQIAALLANAGVHLWQHTGTLSQLKSDLPSAAPGGSPADVLNGLVMLTGANATWGAMQTIFKTA